MTQLFHIIIALSYVICAIAAALALPYTFPAIEPTMARVIGGMVLIGGALLHVVYARKEREALITEELYSLRVAHAEVLQEMRQARAEARQIFESLQAAGTAVGKAGAPSLNEVAAEVKVLQGLVAQLGSGRAAQAAETPAAAAAAGGGGSIVPALRAPVQNRLNDAEVLDIVSDALSQDRVDLYLQPIVSLPQRKRRFYECFSRIRAADGAMIVPERYMEVAEREGLIATIDNMLLFRCVQLVRKTQRNSYNVSFFYNISPHTLADRNFFRDFIGFMAQNAELAPNLIFEFAESDFAALDSEIRQHLERLTMYGFRFSIDQTTGLTFDTAELSTRGVNFIKVEADTLLDAVARDDQDIDVRDLSQSMARHGIDLIVGKIESESALVELLDLNIDFGQGYLFGEPRLSKQD